MAFSADSLRRSHDTERYVLPLSALGVGYSRVLKHLRRLLARFKAWRKFEPVTPKHPTSSVANVTNDQLPARGKERLQAGKPTVYSKFKQPCGRLIEKANVCCHLAHGGYVFKIPLDPLRQLGRVLDNLHFRELREPRERRVYVGERLRNINLAKKKRSCSRSKSVVSLGVFFSIGARSRAFAAWRRPENSSHARVSIRGRISSHRSPIHQGSRRFGRSQRTQSPRYLLPSILRPRLASVARSHKCF